MSQGIGQLINDGLDAVVGPVMALSTLAVEVGQNLSAVALTIMDFLIVIIIVWFGIKMALSSSLDAADYVFNLVKMIVIWSIFYWMVGNYGDLVDYFYEGFDRLNATVEQETVRAIATQAGLGAAEAGRANVGTIDSDLPGSNAIRGLGNFLSRMGNDVRRAEEIINHEIAEKGWREAIPASINGFWVSVKITIIHAVAILATVAYILIYAFVLILITFLQTVVIAIGPIMLMTLMVPYLSFMGDGWIRAAIMVGVMKLVLTIILSVFGGLLLSVTANMDSFQNFQPLPDPVCTMERQPRVGPGGGGEIEVEKCEDPGEIQTTGIQGLSDAFSIMMILPLIITAFAGGVMLLKAPAIAEMFMMGRGFGLATSVSAAGAAGAAKGRIPGMTATGAKGMQAASGKAAQAASRMGGNR